VQAARHLAVTPWQNGSGRTALNGMAGHLAATAPIPVQAEDIRRAPARTAPAGRTPCKRRCRASDRSVLACHPRWRTGAASKKSISSRNGRIQVSLCRIDRMQRACLRSKHAAAIRYQHACASGACRSDHKAARASTTSKAACGQAPSQRSGSPGRARSGLHCQRRRASAQWGTPGHPPHQQSNAADLGIRQRHRC